jgi:hypothetical protein
MAQMPIGPASFNGASLVMMLRDAPLTVERIEERTTKLPDGNSRIKTIEAKIYRDRVGRFRILRIRNLDQKGCEVYVMRRMIRVRIIGDFDKLKISHPITNKSIIHAAKSLSIETDIA